MTSIEKKISFLNRYFVYKKVRTVNTESIELELGEYNETEANRDDVETKHAQSVAKEDVVKSKPKVRKLTKKLLLVAATEAVDEHKTVLEKDTVTKKAKESKAKESKAKDSKAKDIKVKESKVKESKVKASKKIIIENDEDE
jgi:hypothetical protein